MPKLFFYSHSLVRNIQNKIIIVYITAHRNIAFSYHFFPVSSSLSRLSLHVPLQRPLFPIFLNSSSGFLHIPPFFDQSRKHVFFQWFFNAIFCVFLRHMYSFITSCTYRIFPRKDTCFHIKKSVHALLVTIHNGCTSTGSTSHASISSLSPSNHALCNRL